MTKPIPLEYQDPEYHEQNGGAAAWPFIAIILLGAAIGVAMVVAQFY